MTTDLLVTPGYVRTMSAYNSEMNRRIYEAAARLSDAERKREQGAFWGRSTARSAISYGATACGCRVRRLAAAGGPGKESATMIADFATLKAEREAADAKIEAWAARVDEAWLAEDQVWFSGAAGRELSMKRHFL